MNWFWKGIGLLGAIATSGCAVSSGSSPRTLEGPTAEVYKTVGDIKLKLYIYKGETGNRKKPRAAIVFFFGGGWSTGSPQQFEKQAQYFASRGMVAITADYRVRTRHNSKVTDCVSDARSAVRWVRANAEKLGVDPNRIAAAGGSAGGHLAACTAFISKFDDSREDKGISATPDALVLFNPAVTLAPLPGVESSSFRAVPRSEFLGAEASRISPAHHVKAGGPPTIIFHGLADTTVPYDTAQAFSDRMKAAGNDSKLVGYPDQPHGFFNREPWTTRTLIAADEFLAALGWLEGKPTLAGPK
jgi:acetyl esterase/lipase